MEKLNKIYFRTANREEFINIAKFLIKEGYKDNNNSLKYSLCFYIRIDENNLIRFGDEETFQEYTEGYQEAFIENDKIVLKSEKTMNKVKRAYIDVERISEDTYKIVAFENILTKEEINNHFGKEVYEEYIYRYNSFVSGKDEIYLYDQITGTRMIKIGDSFSGNELGKIIDFMKEGGKNLNDIQRRLKDKPKKIKRIEI